MKPVFAVLFAAGAIMPVLGQIPQTATAQNASTKQNTAPNIPELNTLLMQSTFKLQGPKANDVTKTAFGTTFLMAKLKKSNPKEAWNVLISAAHVFDDIGGEYAEVILRRKQADGRFTTMPYPLKIREKRNNIYTKHGRADVAVMYAALPPDLQITSLATDFLADDARLEEFEIHPGDELSCLGFPLYVNTDTGFPVLRSGKISSYPLTPSSIYSTFNYDFPIFEGNSGGPVYFVDRNRIYKGEVHLGGPIQFIVGLVSQQVGAALYGNRRIGLGVVVPAHFILETLALLPEPENK